MPTSCWSTGSVNEKSKQVLKNLYDQMPNPKVIVAVGLCAISGCVFQDCYNVLGGVDKVLPVDVYVPGCAARPESIIDGVIKACDILEEKYVQQKKTKRAISKTINLINLRILTMSEYQEIIADREERPGGNRGATLCGGVPACADRLHYTCRLL